MGKSRLLPGEPSSSEGSSVRPYIPYLQTFKLSSSVFRKRQTQEQRVQTLYSHHLSPSPGEDKHIFMMTPSKKKLPKPKEVSLDPSIKDETPIIELPNDESKLFDKEDDVGTSAIPDLSLPSEDEEENIKSNVWEYTIDVLFKLSPLHPEGNSLRKWVKYQDMETMEQFYQWNENGVAKKEP